MSPACCRTGDRYLGLGRHSLGVASGHCSIEEAFSPRKKRGASRMNICSLLYKHGLKIPHRNGVLTSELGKTSVRPVQSSLSCSPVRGMGEIKFGFSTGKNASGTAAIEKIFSPMKGNTVSLLRRPNTHHRLICLLML